MATVTPILSREDFPIFANYKKKHGDRLAYLDSAATSQKPLSVIQAIEHYYANENANVHRGIHRLGDMSTRRLQQAREKISAFFTVSPTQLIFTRNTTESLNGLSYGLEHLVTDKHEIVVSEIEHHSNIVPWQELAKRTGAVLRKLQVNDEGFIQEDSLLKILSSKTSVVAITHVSNALGTHQPIDRVVEIIRQKAKQAMIVLDGAQSAPHLAVDFSSLGVDAFAFSGHKMLGPMGVGGLLLSTPLLSTLEPWFYGGGMIDEVKMDHSSFADVPDKFMPGTPDVASIVGLEEAVAVLDSLKMKNVLVHDQQLVEYALDRLNSLSFVEVVGPQSAEHRVGSVAFLIKGVHAHDVAQVLDTSSVAVRSGHHCTMPLHEKMGWPATTRASFSVYSGTEDVDALIDGLDRLRSVFSLS